MQILESPQALEDARCVGTFTSFLFTAQHIIRGRGDWVLDSVVGPESEPSSTRVGATVASAAATGRFPRVQCTPPEAPRGVAPRIRRDCDRELAVR